MDIVFFSGSISIKNLPDRIKESLNQIKENGQFKIIVGDASGFDILLQEYCKLINFLDVTVYTIYEKPRNIVEGLRWVTVDSPESLKSERKKQTFKDRKMSEDSDISYVIWDEKSKGSYNNILRAIESNKKVRVFSVKKNSALTSISKELVTKIYQDSNGLTTSDVLDQLFNNGIKEFANAKELNQYLLDNNFVSQDIISGKKVYKTSSDLYSTDIVHRGKHSGVKFKYHVVTTLISKFKVSKSNYGSMRG
ncbi:hypothetical protein [Aliivibrio fischeri]|uniref:hypothetical protein n=1 Tax=Aliivibrio fischeri TaxID=668 RepID=UPI0012DAD878|nr:hypothetical protein [Aliivibrio fischeri]MUJ39699.1 hypothetical protein [Aliivibrio fischeri]